jgi:hypothetical protein
MVLVARERNERKTLANVFQKEQHLFAGQTSARPVGGAAILFFVGVDEGFQTSLVVLMILDEDRDQR